MSTNMNADKLQDSLRTKRFGKTVLFRHSVTSTNDWAKRMAAMGVAEGTVAVAETQTAGRGRLDREWVSPRGGLYFSVIIRPRLHVAEAVKLVFVAGLAVADALRDKHGLKVETRWPNDVLVKGRKICGILTEMNTGNQEVNYVVIGVGINANFDTTRVFPPSLRTVATSIQNELGRTVRLEELFGVTVSKLEKTYDLYEQRGFSSVLAEWKKYAGFLGQRVKVTSQNEKTVGSALDVDEEGALMLRLESGKTRRLYVGDVSLHTP